MEDTRDLTQHPNVGVRWQAQMEDHLKVVRRTHLVQGPTGLAEATAAQAHAIAALALSIANTGSDIETTLAKIGEVIDRADT